MQWDICLFFKLKALKSLFMMQFDTVVIGKTRIVLLCILPLFYNQ